jgi:RHS repeat-associated protein
MAGKPGSHRELSGRSNSPARPAPGYLQTINYAYDLAGHLQNVNNGVNGAVYSYLANSPLVGQIIFTNSGATRMTTTRQYDLLNRLLSISSVPSVGLPLSFSYFYNSANQRIRAVLGDGSYWLYTYDALGQVTSGKRFWQDGTPVAGQQYEYGFDDIGNRQSVSMGGDANWGPLRQAGYTANRLNQYSQRTVPGAVDILGIANPTTNVTVNGNVAYRKGEYFDYALSTPNGSGPWYGTVTVSSSYGAGQSASGTVFVPSTPESFTHDLDGNLTQDGHWNYVWDAENRLVSMETIFSVPDAAKLHLDFSYDYQGRRISKTVSNWVSGAWALLSDARFLYDGWNLLAELNTQNSPLNTYLWGLDLSGTMQGAGGVGGLLMVTYNGSQTTNCLVAYDGNGNVAALADTASTNILARYEYGPFGEVIRTTGPMAKANPFRFSTKYQDDETDLVYYGYRYYSASTGRWLNRDPIEEHGGQNVFAIARNDLVRFIDLLGLSFKVVPIEAAPGTIDPSQPNLFGRTWASKYEDLKLDADQEKLSCSYCAILRVKQDFEVEVTSIKPSAIPTGYNENGFDYIRSHEDRRVDVYRRAYDTYLAPVKGRLDGVMLCCRGPAKGQLLAWGLDMVTAFSSKFSEYVQSQNALIAQESDPGNLRLDDSGLIDGGYYTYEPGPMPAVGPLPELHCPGSNF